MARRRDRMGDVGELQLLVLDALTELGEGTVYDVLARLGEGHRPRYTTVLTVLRALEEKGLVTHQAQGRAHLFRPTTEAAQVRQRLLGHLLTRAFGDSPQALVATLLDVDQVTPEVLRELKALIAAREADSDDD
jgi:BlaI family penicillinase repressor